VIEIRSAATDPAPYLGVAGFEISSEQFARQKPDECLLAREGSRPVARCGVWVHQAPPYPDHRLGVIGHYWADNATAGQAVLREACAQLGARGCTLAVGPMDGNTWQRYRFITERGTEPAFFLEPDNPDEWPGYWTAAGFTPLATYHSALATDLATRHPRAEETALRLAGEGITIRNLDLAQFDAELARLHALSLICFANNFLYTPISAAEFAAQYAPVRNYLRPELALLAEKGGELIGFIVGAPDLLQAKRGARIDTAIAKTMAVHPEFAGTGLGSHLMDLLHAGAQALGFRRAIHALYHADNRSGTISRRTAQIIRTYTLFSRQLGGRA
jgi:GNAT superfamily N-acetyltransferase